MRDNTLKETSDLYDEMLALFEANGISVDDVSLVAPVADGAQTLEQNREMLLTMLEQLES